MLCLMELTVPKSYQLEMGFSQEQITFSVWLINSDYKKLLTMVSHCLKFSEALIGMIGELIEVSLCTSHGFETVKNIESSLRYYICVYLDLVVAVLSPSIIAIHFCVWSM